MSMEAAINGDFSSLGCRGYDADGLVAKPQRVGVAQALHPRGACRVGPGDVGRSLRPGSRFPAHDHPEGEEILVLEGVFSDEHGDWPAGTFLLNPEGFRHAPFSDPGCVLFVKLRQFDGRGRKHVVVDTHRTDYLPSGILGVASKVLYEQAGFSDRVLIERWDPGTDLGVTGYPHGAELFVLDGEFSDEAGTYSAGCWLRFPIGSRHHPRSARGCTL